MRSVLGYVAIYGGVALLLGGTWLAWQLWTRKD